MKKINSDLSDLPMNSSIDANYRSFENNDTFSVSKSGFYRFGIGNATSSGGCSVALLANGLSQYAIDCLQNLNSFVLIYLYANTTYTVVISGSANTIRLYDQ
jgi:hypothetical protein